MESLITEHPFARTPLRTFLENGGDPETAAYLHEKGLLGGLGPSAAAAAAARASLLWKPPGMELYGQPASLYAFGVRAPPPAGIPPQLWPTASHTETLHSLGLYRYAPYVYPRKDSPTATASPSTTPDANDVAPSTSPGGFRS
ncbi:hypothetical protein IscW_ISCW019691 [Ixodes scapularis]|uniref:Uncharacterized protein n=1 Tax=Ixodes scapularis TaxID=6945 RepID=B7PW01_IXOSC|nr:hypothetical protein IscW_ISCW019691 [Ixodes scapularis]|eukprot:XP_002408901.1 hypothetical protein IscW_ISCW019691 [Ixodes scapularis]